MKGAGLAALLVATAFGSPAFACSLRDVGPDNYWAATDVMPRMLYGQASSIEVVEVEGARPYVFTVADFPDIAAHLAAAKNESARTKAQADLEERIQWQSQFDVSLVTFRVVERIKGDGPDRFTLSAIHRERTVEDTRSQARAIANRGDFSDPLTIFARVVVEAKAWGGGGACVSTLWTMNGQQYLVFRNKDGGLLEGAVPAAIGWSLEETYVTSGPIFEAVSGDDDPWLLRVREARAKEIAALKALAARPTAGGY